METPPPYSNPSQKKSKTGLIIGIVVGVIAVCCIVPIGGLALFAKNAIPGAVGMVACGWSAENTRDAIVQYAGDHNGKLPAAAKWQDEIKDYVDKIAASHKKQQKEEFKMPNGTSDFCDGEAKTSLAYNTQVAGKKLEELQNSSIVVVFEVAGLGRNKSMKFTEQDAKLSPKLVMNLPRGWVEQPLEGEAYVRNAQGVKSPIPRDGKKGSNPFNVETKSSN